MPRWTFWDYIDTNGQNQIMAWLESFSEGVRPKIKAKLVSLFGQANAVGRLTRPRFEILHGNYRELIAIRFERNRIQYRVLACYGNEAGGVVWLLAGGVEKNNNYRPPGVLDTALQRRANVLGGLSQVRLTCLLENN